jgi:hypothetical protein
MDANAHIQGEAQMRAKVTDCGNNLEGSTRSLYRIIIVGMRIPKVNTKRVTFLSVDKACAPLDGALTKTKVSADNVAKVFRVKSGRQRGRADQVTKDNGDLASFAHGTACLRGTGPT